MAWIRFDGTFKQLWDSRNEANSCFIDSGLKNYDWQDGGKLLRLDDAWRSSKGGYLTFTVGKNWKVALRLATENANYFQDEIDARYLEDEGTSKPAYPTNEEDAVVWEDKALFGENQSNLFITLNEGDILLIDVNAGNVDKTLSFRIYKDGVDYIRDYNADSVKVADDTFVRVIEAFYNDPDAVATEEGITGDDGEGSSTVKPEGGVVNPDDLVIDPEDVGGDKEIDPVEPPTPPTPPADDDMSKVFTAIVMSLILVGVGLAAFSLLRRNGGEPLGE